MQRLLASLILAAAMFVGIAMPKSSPERAIGVHLVDQSQQENLVFGDGAHKRWKELAEQGNYFNE